MQRHAIALATIGQTYARQQPKNIEREQETKNKKGKKRKMVYHQWFINTYQYEVYHHHVNGISMVYQWYLNRASWCIINVRVYHPNGESMAKKKVTPLESSHHHNRPVRGAHHIILLFRSTSSVEISINSHESFDRCKWKYIYCHGSYR